MTSSDPELRMPPRKRSRTMTDAKDSTAPGSKKTRGRPRVESKNQDAVERRRTQIREAQRAYRKRKETTIAHLQAHQNQLQSIIGQMSRAFDHVNNVTLKSGVLQLNPTLAQEFKAASDTFTNLVNTANDDKSIDDDEEIGEAGEITGDGSSAPDAQPEIPNAAVAEPQDVGWGYSVTNPTGKANSPDGNAQAYSHNQFAQPETTHAQAGTDTSLVRHPQFTIDDILDPRAPQKASPEGPTILPFGLVDLDTSQPFMPPGSSIYSIDIPTPELTLPSMKLCSPPARLPSLLSTNTVRPLTTYSFDESTFARRLTRAAIETGFQLLNDAEVRPEALKYIFKLSLPWFSLDQLIDRFKIMLSRGINDGLDFWETPFIHLGGAGTHYPRRDSMGNTIPIRNGWTVRQIGPVEKKMVQLDSKDNGLTQHIDGVDLSGFQGVWYDAHDVEGYFEEKYLCKIDPRTSFAECWIDEDDPIANTIFSPSEHYDMSTRRNSGEASVTPSLTHSSSSDSSSSSVAAIQLTNSYKPPDTLFSTAGPSSHDQTRRPSNELPRFPQYDLSFDQTLGLDLAPVFDNGFSGTNAWTESANLGLDLMGDGDNGLPVVRQRRKKSALVDINTLVDGEQISKKHWLKTCASSNVATANMKSEIVKYAVCLGRAPGFRRDDVDLAFHKSLLPAY